MSIDIFPNAAIVSSAILLQSSCFETSATIASVLEFIFFTSSTLAESFIESLATITTPAQCFANTNAQALPIPDEAPVITTILSFNLSGHLCSLPAKINSFAAYASIRCKNKR